MSDLPYHKRYHSDALAGFMALSLEERGAYQTLLDLIYDRGGPLPDNDTLLAGYMNCSARKWKAVKSALVAKGKILVENGLVDNFRARKELENLLKTHRKLSDAGHKGGKIRAEKAKKGNENNESGQAGLKLGTSEASSQAQASRARPDARSQNTSPKGDAAFAAEVDPLKVLFDEGVAYLSERGVGPNQARQLIGMWRRDYGDDEVSLAFAAAKDEGVSEPKSWISKRLAARKQSGAINSGGQSGGQRSFIDVVLAEAEAAGRLPKPKPG